MMAYAKKLILLLADPTLSTADFVELEAWLKADGLAQVFTAARSMRRDLRALANSVKDSRISDVAVSSTEADQATEIIRQIVSGTSLSEPRVISLLQRRVDPTTPPRVLRPFRAAVARLIKSYGADRVLAAAKGIRNELAHDDRDSSWKLKGS